MEPVGDLFAWIAKIAIDKVSGSAERTDQLIQIGARIVTAFRGNPRPVAEIVEAAKDRTAIQAALANAIKTVPNGAQLTQSERRQVELALTVAVADLPIEMLADAGTPAASVVEKITTAVDFGDKTFLLWLQPPILEDASCFCHFFCSWNPSGAEWAFRIRDYIHSKVYYGVTPAAPPQDWLAVDRMHLTAVNIWEAAHRHVRCRGLFDHRVTDTAPWRRTLEEMTRELAPCPPGACRDN